MKGLNSINIRSGRLACCLILITSLLICLHCQSYTRSYAMPIEDNEAQHTEETQDTEKNEKESIEDQKKISESTEGAGATIVKEKTAMAETATLTAAETDKVSYEIPSSFVNPATGNTVSYKGGKTIERTSMITYGDAGEINRLATPDRDGFMKLDNRYLIAVGSRFDTEVGQYLDLILENGVVIPCIMGDLKADEDTDSTNTFTCHSRCCSEFIIDENSIRSDIYERGNASLKHGFWDSPVVNIIVYDEYYEFTTEL